MVDQLMSAKKSSLELQAEDFMEDQLSPLHKRSKLDSSLQVSLPFPSYFLGNQTKVWFLL